MHKISSVHIQCANNYYTKFEYKGMKTFGVQITQTRLLKCVADGLTDRQTDGQTDGRTDGVDPLLVYLNAGIKFGPK